MKFTDAMFTVLGIERVKPENNKPLRMLKLEMCGPGDYAYVDITQHSEGSKEFDEVHIEEVVSEEGLPPKVAEVVKRIQKIDGCRVTIIDGQIVVDMPDRTVYDVSQLTDKQLEDRISVWNGLREKAKELELEFDLQAAKKLMEEEERKLTHVAIIGSGRVGMGSCGVVLAKNLEIYQPEAYPGVRGFTDNEGWKPTKIKKGANHNKFKRRKK